MPAEGKTKVHHPSLPGKCLVCKFETPHLSAARAHHRDTGHTTWSVPHRWTQEADSLSFDGIFRGSADD